MNIEQLKRLYQMARNMRAELMTDKAGIHDIDGALHNLQETIKRELKDAIWFEYKQKELK